MHFFTNYILNIFISTEYVHHSVRSLIVQRSFKIYIVTRESRLHLHHFLLLHLQGARKKLRA